MPLDGLDTRHSFRIHRPSAVQLSAVRNAKTGIRLTISRTRTSFQGSEL